MLGVSGCVGGFRGLWGHPWDLGTSVGPRNVICVDLRDLCGSRWHLGVLGTGVDPAGHLLVLEASVGSEVVCGFQGDLEVSVLSRGI